MMEPAAQGHTPWQPARHGLGPITLPHGASVRNTFLEFHEETIEEEDDEDPWVLMPGRAPRLQTDSVVERSSQSLRFSLEQNIRAALDAQRLSLNKQQETASQPATGGSSPTDQPHGTVATSMGAPWASDASSFNGTWASDVEEEAGEDLGSVVQDLAPIDIPPAAAPVAKVVTPPRGSVQTSKATLQPKKDADDPDQKVLSANSNLEGKTTVMVRNVPAKFVQQKLMREINAAGFLGKYDFLYLPMHPGGRGNRGFAFINFTSPEAAEAFKLAFDGSRFRHFNNSQPLAIVAADLQGFEENAAHYLGVLKTASAGGRRVPPASHAPLFFRPLPPHLDSEYNGACATDDYSGSQLQAQQQHVAACSQDQIQQMTMLLAAAMPMPTAPPAASTQRIAQFCAYCGGRRSQDHRFCAFCGAPCSPPVAAGLTQ